MYSNLPADGQAPERTAGSRFPAAGVAVGGGCCVLLLTLLALSAPGPALQGAGVADGISLVGLPRGPALAASLPVPSPWKELALAAMEGANTCDRDVSAAARRGIMSVMANMGGRDR